ncbi:hypothetical protein HpHA234_09510 [Helicobacter pylori]
MNYPNLPNSDLEITSQPEVKEITNELLNKKGLKDFKIADVTKDMFNPDSKEFKDIDIYDFTHYLLMANREPNENNPALTCLIEAVKDMQKESEKGIKKASKRSAEESEK